MSQAVNGMKKCPKCGVIKPVSEFYKDKSRGDGFYNICKLCQRSYVKQYRQEHADDIKTYHKQYYQEHAEDYKLHHKQYYQEHADDKKTYHKQYYQEHADKKRDKSKQYYACTKHPSCPAVGGNGAEFVIFTCPICGKAFRRLKSQVDYKYERKGQTKFCCSRGCASEARRKTHVTDYEKNIKRIRKEQNL